MLLTGIELNETGILSSDVDGGSAIVRIFAAVIVVPEQLD